MFHAYCFSQGSPCLTDYVKLKTIGTGTFGKVLLVQHRHKLKYYAMKVLEKAKVCTTALAAVIIATILHRWLPSNSAIMLCMRRIF